LTFKPQICSPITRVLGDISTKFEVSTSLLFRVNWRRRTDGQTDRRMRCNN